MGYFLMLRLFRKHTLYTIFVHSDMLKLSEKILHCLLEKYTSQNLHFIMSIKSDIKSDQPAFSYTFLKCSISVLQLSERLRLPKSFLPKCEKLWFLSNYIKHASILTKILSILYKQYMSSTDIQHVDVLNRFRKKLGKDY